MKNLKKLLALALMTAMVFAFAACSSSDEEAETLLVVTEPTFAPFDTTDEDGNIVGFDMDLISAIAEDQGFEVEFQSLEFDALIPALESDQADIIAAGMNSLDEDRAAKVDFSDSYYDSGLVVMVAADNTTVNSIDDVDSSMKIAAQLGTTGADMANEKVEAGEAAEAVILNKYTDCFLQLENGDVQVVIVDKPVADQYLKTSDAVKIVGDTMNAEAYAFAVQKGNTELLEKINEGLANMIENGTYDELYAKWFESEE